MTDPFATPAELATYLRTATQAEADAGSSDVLDTSIALAALASASATIRAMCGWSISQETVTEPVSPGVAFLPTLHLTAVSVTAAGVPVDAADFTWSSSGVVRFGVRYWHAPVVITYTHGYSPVPDVIKAVCLELAGQSYGNPAGVASETYGNVTTVYTRGGGDTMVIDARLAAYKLPTIA